jgi:hypothetical protein
VKKLFAAALATCGFVFLMVIMAAFGAAAQISNANAACAPAGTMTDPGKPRGKERPAGGGVFVGGKWHYTEQPGPKWTPERIARTAAQYGLPGRTFAQIARGESNYRPYVVQHDPGDGNVGFGFFQFTPNAWGKDSIIAKKLQSLGGQRGLEDIGKQFELARFMYIAAGHSISPWYGTQFVTDRTTPRVTTPLPGSLEQVATCAMTPDTGGPVEGSPKHVIDSIVLPLAKKCGITKTVAENDAANARHGATVNGGLSDHQGPPDQRWATDISNGSSPTPEMDCHAEAVAKRFGIPWTGSGAVSRTQGAYRVQLIYRSTVGGNHYNHTHTGVAAVAGPF